MDKQLLSQLRSNDIAAVASEDIAQKLRSSGILEFLKSMGVVRVVPGSSINDFAFEAAEKAGYNRALEELMNFKELFLRVEHNVPARDFSGLEKALKKGDLTEQELHDLRGANSHAK